MGPASKMRGGSATGTEGPVAINMLTEDIDESSRATI